MRDREPQPTFIAPMLLTSADVPGGEAWTLEVKWDGCRAQLRYDGRSVSVRTRTGRNCTEEFPELAAIISVVGRHRVTLDGELVCLRGDGRPDFARLRSRLSAAPETRSRRCSRSSMSCISMDVPPARCRIASDGRGSKS